MQEHRLTELHSGVRVVTEAMPSVRSAALGFFVGTGSRAEGDDQAGLSHLLEHLLFRGTARFSSLEVDQIFDTMGAELNAGTGKETTSVYARVLDRQLPRAFEVVSDIVWRPSLEELDAERAVVLEEIAMYEDDPQDKVFDVLGRAVFGEHPLGRSIIGRAQVISETPREAIVDFHHARYVPANIVIAAAGSVDHDEIVAMAREHSPDGTASQPHAPTAPRELSASVCFERKETEQYHVCLGAPGLARGDDRRFALRVLDNVLGGTTSSRLFQEVRERRGLAYAVYSFSAQYADTGQVGIYVGTRGDNLVEAMEVVAAELEKIRENPASEGELQRSKENVKGRLVLSLESTTTRMNRLGSSVLCEVPLLSVDELIERVDAVTLDDLRELVTELYAAPRLSAAGIGPDEGAFQRALEPVGALAAGAA
ncbi:MAG: insulinase family protein [Actinomycetota bacterium]|nr:insulinase family protein [Actinomycetota bacterium]